eukprot:4517394-Alexandrium_andersonii.AAC.1
MSASLVGSEMCIRDSPAALGCSSVAPQGQARSPASATQARAQPRPGHTLEPRARTETIGQPSAAEG